ncbi:polysaccharide deacetylase family protein [Paucibacter sp. AS339]|uniref:polysaccharide deacetylase family protein n=1 Tax=Paucibacter hankyongi TaxID=3133434 RepID=UPI0030A0BBA8
MKIFFLFLLHHTGIFYLFRKLSASQTTILCYHAGSYGDEWQFNGNLFMRASTFNARMNWLKLKNFEFISLAEATSTRATGKRNRVTITFDDGWLSTCTDLIPILQFHQAPSTLYLSTQQFLSNRPITGVLLRYMRKKTQTRMISNAILPAELGKDQPFESDQEIDAYAKKIELWIENTKPTKAQVYDLFEAIAASIGISSDTLDIRRGRFEFASLRDLQTARLAGCQIELHGHIHKYPVNDPTAFQLDLQICSEIIESLGFPKPKHYCYPSGRHDSAASGVLSSLKIDTATTCLPGQIRSQELSRLHYLPRFLDGEGVHPLEFEAELSGLTPALRRLVKLFKAES